MNMRPAESSLETVRQLQGVVELCTQLCRVPRAAINLVTPSHQHQVIAAGVEPSVCAREESMCGRVLDDLGPVVVPDARSDARFTASRFVTSGEIRFYASFPLVVHGAVIGRLCVWDSETAAVAPHVVAMLAGLARQASSILEEDEHVRTLQRRISDLETANTELRRSYESLALFAAQVGHDLRTPLSAVVLQTEMLAAQPEVAGTNGSPPAPARSCAQVGTSTTWSTGS